MNNVLVIGYKGEIGSAILKLIENSEKYNIFKKDVDDIEIKEKIDIMHICIPYFDNFVDIAVDYVGDYKPGLVIINSTVRPETTQKIHEKANCRMVHSPVRGKHPNIRDGLLKAIKFIGPIDKESGDMAKEHFESLGIKCSILRSPIETELGKLFSTTYYALCIAYHQEMERVCKKFDSDFEQTVTRFNESYNAVCREINPKVVRPILSPGFIGGHCLMPNIALLKKDVKSDFLDIIEESNKKKNNDLEKEK
jgi:UDP-N-acetyl-D-mannosaminuronate dehydrogenase